MVVRDMILKSVGRSWLIIYRASRPLYSFSEAALRRDDMIYPCLDVSDLIPFTYRTRELYHAVPIEC